MSNKKQNLTDFQAIQADSSVMSDIENNHQIHLRGPIEPKLQELPHNEQFENIGYTDCNSTQDFWKTSAHESRHIFCCRFFPLLERDQKRKPFYDRSPERPNALHYRSDNRTHWFPRSYETHLPTWQNLESKVIHCLTFWWKDFIHGLSIFKT